MEHVFSQITEFARAYPRLPIEQEDLQILHPSLACLCCACFGAPPRLYVFTMHARYVRLIRHTNCKINLSWLTFTAVLINVFGPTRFARFLPE
jgi:hypothetical protein